MEREHVSVQNIFIVTVDSECSGMFACAFAVRREHEGSLGVRGSVIITAECSDPHGCSGAARVQDRQGSDLNRSQRATVPPLSRRGVQRASTKTAKSYQNAVRRYRIPP